MTFGKPLNILCCSTRQWNPGDEWIALGVRRLFAGIFKDQSLNWILYDRSPDCFTAPWESPERRSDLLANSFQPNGSTRAFDLVVAAGTPEWRGPHFQSVFHATSALPWFFLGIDHIHPGEIEPTPDELVIWSTACIVTRGALGSEALGRIGVQALTMPCPSLFAAAWERPSRQLARIGVVLQNDRVVNQSIPQELKTAMLRVIKELRHHYDVVVFCNYIDEFLVFKETLDVPVRYAYDSADYLDMMSSCDVIVSTRLHSAFLANSLLKPAIVINDSSRVQSATDLYPFVYCLQAHEVLSWLRQFNVATTVRDLLNWKRTQEREYGRVLIEQLRHYDLYQI